MFHSQTHSLFYRSFSQRQDIIWGYYLEVRGPGSPLTSRWCWMNELTELAANPCAANWRHGVFKLQLQLSVSGSSKRIPGSPWSRNGTTDRLTSEPVTTRRGWGRAVSVLHQRRRPLCDRLPGKSRGKQSRAERAIGRQRVVIVRLGENAGSMDCF